MKLALRDDDTCFFTSPDLLERAYHDVWDRVPVCLSTVPFAKGPMGYVHAGSPEAAVWRSGETFPLDRNRELVRHLKQLIERRRATVALHGYTHEDFPNGYEFQAAPDPERRITKGVTYLQDVLGTRIGVFVPPHNALSKAGLRAVGRAKLNLLGSFLSFRPSMRPWEWRTAQNFWRIRRYRAATGRAKHDRFVYPFALHYRHHTEFGCHGLIPGTTLEDLIRGFDEARSLGGDFCLATHHWEIDEPMAKVLRSFLDYAGRSSDTRFVTVEELFR
jgi:predicted deacetylase